MKLLSLKWFATIQISLDPGHAGGGGGVFGICIGSTPKMGVLGECTSPKKGGLRCGHNQKKRGLRHVYNPNKGEFRTDFVKRQGVRN